MWERAAREMSGAGRDTVLDDLRSSSERVSIRHNPGAYEHDLMDAVEAAVRALGQEERKTLPCPPFEKISHAHGGAASPALTRFLEIDPTFLGLPIDEEGRLGTGAELGAILEQFVDAELSTFAPWIGTIFPGFFYALPTSLPTSLHVLFVSGRPDETLEIVLALETGADGMLDVRIAYPSIELYLADAFGVIVFDPTRVLEDAATIAPLEWRFFDGRPSLFATESDA
jgi:hypothetical protein